MDWFFFENISLYLRLLFPWKKIDFCETFAFSNIVLGMFSVYSTDFTKLSFFIEKWKTKQNNFRTPKLFIPSEAVLS